MVQLQGSHHTITGALKIKLKYNSKGKNIKNVPYILVIRNKWTFLHPARSLRVFFFFLSVILIGVYTG